MRKKSNLVTGLLVLCVLAAASYYLVVREKRITAQRAVSTPLAQGATLTQVATFFEEGQKPRIKFVSTRAIRRDGSFWERRVTPEGKEWLTFSNNGKMVSQVNSKPEILNELAPLPTTGSAQETERALLSWAGVRKHEPIAWILGVKCVVDRKPDDDGNGYTDYYRAPSLGGFILRIDHVLEKAKARYLIDTTGLVWGEPDSGQFEKLPRNLPSEPLQKGAQ